jgi:hypothetical protein
LSEQTPNPGGSTANLPNQLERHVKIVTTVRLVFALLSIPLFCSAGWAYPNSLKMTCSDAQAYIAKNDGAILSTGDEFASFMSQNNCSGGIPAYVRTRDVRYCFVGVYCGSDTLVPDAGYYQGTDENR